MNKALYARAQTAISELKGVVYELLAESENQNGLSNAEVGRALGIYRGHVGHEGHISRTILQMLEVDEVAKQDPTTKLWSLTKLHDTRPEA